VLIICFLFLFNTHTTVPNSLNLIVESTSPTIHHPDHNSPKFTLTMNKPDSALQQYPTLTASVNLTLTTSLQQTWPQHYHLNLTIIYPDHLPITPILILTTIHTLITTPWPPPHPDPDHKCQPDHKCTANLTTTLTPDPGHNSLCPPPHHPLSWSWPQFIPWPPPPHPEPNHNGCQTAHYILLIYCTLSRYKSKLHFI